MIKKRAILGLFLTGFLCLGISRCTHIPLDSSALAATSGDETIIFQGGGAKSKKGYLFLQQREGTFPTDVIAVLAPKLNCKRESCVRFQFFRKDGSTGFGGAIPKGQTRVDFTLGDILGHTNQVVGSDDGEYSAIVQVFYQGADDQEYSRVMNGFVRLNVLAPGYDPVPCGDPAIGWKLKTSDLCEAQFTTAGRAVVCGKGCDE